MIGIENFNAVPKEEPEAEEVDIKEPDVRESMEANVQNYPEVDGYSATLGDGFDQGFFEGKTGFFTTQEMYDGWNAFIQQEVENSEDLAVEKDMFTKLFEKLTNAGDVPMLFPVFVQGLQSHYENENLPEDIVTPERMDNFYQYMLGEVG